MFWWICRQVWGGGRLHVGECSLKKASLKPARPFLYDGDLRQKASPTKLQLLSHVSVSCPSGSHGYTEEQIKTWS